MSSLHTIFCGGFNIVMHNTMLWQVLVFTHTKIDATPISGVSRINAKLWHWSREPKIGLASIFVWSHTNKCYVSQLHTKILACLQNMGAQLPLFRIFHPNPCARRTHPKMGCVLRAHGFGWKIRDNGSSAPIFCRQASILSYNWAAYQTLVWENRKIDAKPIFRPLDQWHNFDINSGDGESWRGIDFCVHKHQHMVCCHIYHIYIRLATKYGA